MKPTHFQFLRAIFLIGIILLGPPANLAFAETGEGEEILNVEEAEEEEEEQEEVDAEEVTSWEEDIATEKEVLEEETREVVLEEAEEEEIEKALGEEFEGEEGFEYALLETLELEEVLEEIEGSSPEEPNEVLESDILEEVQGGSGATLPEEDSPTEKETKEEERNEKNSKVVEEKEEVSTEKGFGKIEKLGEEKEILEDSKNSSEDLPLPDFPLDEEEVSEEKEEEVPALIKRALFKKGILELEFEIEEGREIIITKKELMKSKSEKFVRVSSKEHFEKELRVYSNLPRPVKWGEAKIFWENENKEVTRGIRYHDPDENGNYARISWIVEHLSTQYYTLEVSVLEGGDSEEIEITILSPLEGEVVSNPVNFTFDINYTNTSSLDCLLQIEGYAPWDGSSEIELDEGSHSWTYDCIDINNTNNTGEVSGNFSVVDSFDLSISSEFDLVTEDLGFDVDANGGVVELTLIQPDGTSISIQNLTGVGTESYPYSSQITKGLLVVPGDYSLVATSHYYSQPATIIQNFTREKLNVDFDSTAEPGESVDFTIQIDSAHGGTYDLKVGNDLIAPNLVFGSGTPQTISSTFASEGDFSVELVAKMGIPQRTYTYDAGNLKIESTEDEEAPDVDLDSPGWEEIIYESEIDFYYTATDNEEVVNCTFQLFDSNYSSSGVYEEGELLFPKSSADRDLAYEGSIVHGEENVVKLIEFDEGSYIWEARCFDSSGNEGWDFNYFEVNLSSEESSESTSSSTSEVEEENSYGRSDNVNALLEEVNDFIEKERFYSPQVGEVLEALEISEKMSLYKKQLIQIEQDLKFNLKFVEEEKLDGRLDEIDAQIEEISENAIKDITVASTHEFSKSRLDSPLEDIISDYLDSTGATIQKRSLKKLIQFNQELQNKLTLDVEAMEVEIEYIEGKKDFVIVSKSVKTNNVDDGLVLEFIPENLGSVLFVTGAKTIEEDLYEIDLESLEGQRMVYYFEDSFDLEKIEKTESILFSEGGPSSSSITGFSIVGGETLGGGILFFFIIFLFINYIGFLAYSKVKMEKWKKEPQVMIIYDLLIQTKRAVRENSVEVARKNYHQMAEIYKGLPQKCKPYFYKEIQRLRLAIDKKDVLNLIKEYERCKNEFRKEDAATLHQKINQIYKKLPKRFQEKVYQRLVKGSI